MKDEKPLSGSKKKKIGSNPLLIACIIIIGLFLFFFLSTKFLSYTQRENYEYMKINDTMRIKGKVLRVYEDKGFSFITLSDSLKIWFPHSRNFDYKISYLADFILVGDSIEKNPYNDTLIIYRGSNQYFFVLGKFINQPGGLK